MPGPTKADLETLLAARDEELNAKNGQLRAAVARIEELAGEKDALAGEKDALTARMATMEATLKQLQGQLAALGSPVQQPPGSSAQQPAGSPTQQAPASTAQQPPRSTMPQPTGSGSYAAAAGARADEPAEPRNGGSSRSKAPSAEYTLLVALPAGTPAPKALEAVQVAAECHPNEVYSYHVVHPGGDPAAAGTSASHSSKPPAAKLVVVSVRRQEVQRSAMRGKARNLHRSSDPVLQRTYINENLSLEQRKKRRAWLQSVQYRTAREACQRIVWRGATPFIVHPPANEGQRPEFVPLPPLQPADAQTAAGAVQ
jgi:hypothetical protein